MQDLWSAEVCRLAAYALRKKDWLANVTAGAKAHLLVFPSGVKKEWK